jgi:hypothetical protein
MFEVIEQRRTAMNSQTEINSGTEMHSQINAAVVPKANSNSKIIPLRIQKLHAEAVAVTKVYSKAENRLISIFEELAQNKGYLHYGVTRLIDYGIEVLGLSESASVNISIVAGKSVKFPKLKEAVVSGEVTISKARRIASAITTQNQDALIDLAKTSTSRAVEKEIARLNPQLAIPEKLKYKTEDRLELTLGISEKLSEKIKRAKDILSQNHSKCLTTEEAIRRGYRGSI